MGKESSEFLGVLFISFGVPLGILLAVLFFANRTQYAERIAREDLFHQYIYPIPEVQELFNVSVFSRDAEIFGSDSTTFSGFAEKASRRGQYVPQSFSQLTNDLLLHAMTKHRALENATMMALQHVGDRLAELEFHMQTQKHGDAYSAGWNDGAQTAAGATAAGLLLVLAVLTATFVAGKWYGEGARF